jgi:nickel-dependent lactate racemase
MAARLRLVDHDAFDDRNLVTLGTTSRGNEVAINRAVWESDRIILTGEIIYHMIAGFSGGRKSLLPGVAGARSTTFNHAMIFDPRCTIGVLEGNPAHEDMLEACRMVAPDFIVNVILAPSGALAHVAAGHYEQAHREGCRAAERLLATPVERPFDTVVASAGGHPLDTDLRQAHKGMENACRALAPGGTLVYYAECAHGIGIQPIVDFLVHYDTEEQMEQALRREFVVGGHKAYWLRRMGGKYRVRLVSDLDPRLVERCHFEPVPLAAHAAAAGEAARAGRVAVIPHAGATLPVGARMI